jgi:Uma2 family endonuclease
MGQGAAIDEKWRPATVTAPGLSEAEFVALCKQHPDFTVEYNAADGTVILMPPTDPESGGRVVEVVWQLRTWAGKSGPGRVLGPDGGFRLPNGSRRSPDAAWFSRTRWAEAKRSSERYPVFAPDFIIELRSPDDRLVVLRKKMEEYIANGVRLGWLIDPKTRSVTIYRAGRPPEALSNPATVAGEGPVKGFVLSLDGIL